MKTMTTVEVYSDSLCEREPGCCTRMRSASTLASSTAGVVAELKRNSMDAGSVVLPQRNMSTDARATTLR